MARHDYDTKAIELYGMKLQVDTKTQRHYQRQIDRCKEILGDRYLLAKPMERINGTKN